jgi:hypothetical protein
MKNEIDPSFRSPQPLHSLFPLTIVNVKPSALSVASEAES